MPEWMWLIILTLSVPVLFYILAAIFALVSIFFTDIVTKILIKKMEKEDAKKCPDKVEGKDE